jgi:hypothetical protein
MTIRSLTDNGMRVFRESLAAIREGTLTALPDELVNGALSSPVEAAGAVETVVFQSKLECATYLKAALENVDRAVVDLNVGMWAWLAVFYFDLLIKRDESGQIDLRDDALYFPMLHSRREYRHLIRGPYKVFDIHGEEARLLLKKPLNVWSDVEEQLVGVQELLRMPGAMRAADRLYFDEARNQAKKGITNRKKDGNIRRFGAVIQQFDLTYDLYSMNGDELLELLPREFNGFRR